MATVEESMLAAGVDRIVMINTLLTSPPGQPASRIMRFFMWMPGTMGRGAREQQAVIDALGHGAFSSLRWTVVRGALNVTEHSKAATTEHFIPGHSGRRVSEYRSLFLLLQV
jgi:hypothetical protein